MKSASFKVSSAAPDVASLPGSPSPLQNFTCVLSYSILHARTNYMRMGKGERA